MNLGFPELIAIFVVALILFGPRKLPELGRSLGRSIAEFKKASNELRSTLDEEIRQEERRNAAAAPAPAPPPAALPAPAPSVAVLEPAPAPDAARSSPALADVTVQPIARGQQGS